MRQGMIAGGALLAYPALDPMTASARRKRGLVKERRIAVAEKLSRCDVHGCERKPSRFLGSRRTGWLHFCSFHREIAFIINSYFHNHHIF